MACLFTKPRRSRLIQSGVAILAVAMAVSGCGSSSSSSASPGKTKFGLITQLSIAPYFATEAAGAKAKAKELGVDLQVVDAGHDTGKNISLTQSLITSGVKGLAIVPSNTDIGPRVSTLTQRADVALVASDSPLADSSGKAAPFVGLDNAGSGKQVGEILAREFTKRGWSAADTYYADVQAATLQVCMLRTDASVKAFEEGVPGFDPSHVVKLPYDGTPAPATASMKAAITAHPDVKHWVISSCNDDGVAGALRALQAKGHKATDSLGVGLGGNLACQVFTTPYLAAGMPIVTYLDAKKIGATVVQTLYDIVVSKKPVPANVYVATPEANAENYKEVAGCP